MGLGRHNTRRDGLLPETKTSATRLSKTLMALKTWITRMKPSLLLLSQACHTPPLLQNVFDCFFGTVYMYGQH